MLVTPFSRITGLHYSYGCATLVRGYVGYLYLYNYWVSLYLWVSSLNGSPWFALRSELLNYTTLLGYLYLLNYQITLYLWVCDLNCSLCLLALRREKLCDITLMVALP